jgi:hypothetical protein
MLVRQSIPFLVVSVEYQQRSRMICSFHSAETSIDEETRMGEEICTSPWETVVRYLTNFIYLVLKHGSYVEERHVFVSFSEASCRGSNKPAKGYSKNGDFSS